ncbi:MAG: hypothetical protein QM602_07635 [Microbacterium sp.]
MFVVALALFVLGIITTGVSFSLPPFQPIVFVAGILLVSLALALPIHFGRWPHERHGS